MTGANAALTQSQAAASNQPTNFVAQFTPEQLATFQQMLGFANGNPVPSTLSGAGTGQLASGTAGATGALTDLLSAGSTDPTAANLASATAYAQNPYIGQMVDNALQTAREQVRDVTLPGITTGAAASGNTNSSRTGIAQGLVERALAEQGAGLYGQLAGSAYSQGLSQAEQQREANLGALSTAGGLGTTIAGQGSGNLGGSIGAAGDLFSLAQGGGAGLQASQQAAIDQILQKYGFGVQAPYAPLQSFASLINPVAALGTQGTSSGTSTYTPSIYQVIGGLMNSGGNAYKALYGGG